MDGWLHARYYGVPRYISIYHGPPTRNSTTNPPIQNKPTGPLQPAASYGADLTGTLFQGEASGWNLSRLDNMIKLLPDELPGITSAMLYFGT